MTQELNSAGELSYFHVAFAEIFGYFGLIISYLGTHSFCYTGHHWLNIMTITKGNSLPMQILVFLCLILSSCERSDDSRVPQKQETLSEIDPGPIIDTLPGVCSDPKSMNAVSFTYSRNGVLFVCKSDDCIKVARIRNKLGLAPEITVCAYDGFVVQFMVTNHCFDLGYAWDELSAWYVDFRLGIVMAVFQTDEVGLHENAHRPIDPSEKFYEFEIDEKARMIIVYDYDDSLEQHQHPHVDSTMRVFPFDQ